MPTLKDKKKIMKEERCHYDFANDRNSKVFAVSWKYNNTVKIMSNNEGLDPMRKVNKWSRNEKKYVKVDQPYCIANYNKTMVDVEYLCQQIPLTSNGVTSISDPKNEGGPSLPKAATKALTRQCWTL